MSHFKFDQSRADQVALANWASEVAQGSESLSKETDRKESYCINSTRTRERQTDVFFQNHKFKRR